MNLHYASACVVSWQAMAFDYVILDMSIYAFLLPTKIHVYASWNSSCGKNFWWYRICAKVHCMRSNYRLQYSHFMTMPGLFTCSVASFLHFVIIRSPLIHDCSKEIYDKWGYWLTQWIRNQLLIWNCFKLIWDFMHYSSCGQSGESTRTLGLT